MRWRLAFAYGAGAVLAAVAAAWPMTWPMIWLSAGLGLTALAYATGRPGLLGKGMQGLGPALRFVALPVRVGARLNAWAWTRGHTSADKVVSGLWLGAHRAAPAHTRVLDLTVEMPVVPGAVNLPLLDLVVPGPAQLAKASRMIDTLHRQARAEGGTLLVACALGLSRSASAVATWLVATGRAADAASAREMLRARRADVHLRLDHLAAIDDAAQLLRRDVNAHPQRRRCRRDRRRLQRFRRCPSTRRPPSPGSGGRRSRTAGWCGPSRCGR